MIRNFDIGATYHIRPGDHFHLMLPDGTVLEVEQTADDFQIVRQHNDLIAYTKTTNPHLADPTAAETTGKN